MHFKKNLTMLFSLVLISCAPFVLAADEEKNDRLARVVMITAHDGHEMALEEAITKYHHTMGDIEGGWRYTWYSILTGPDTGKYIARSGGHNWADFDIQDRDWNKAAGEKFGSEVQSHIANADIMISQLDDTVGIWPEDWSEYQYFSLTDWHIKPGHGSQFSDGLKKVDSILKEDGSWPTYYAFSRAVSGGNGNTITIIIPRKNFADMAPKKPTFYDIMGKAMGDDESQAFFAEWSKSYEAGQNRLLKRRNDLSDHGDNK